MTFKDMLPTNKQWLTIVLFGLLVLVGGVGTCTKSVGPWIDPSPKPVPVPNPVPAPTPNDVWQVLELPAKNQVKGLALPPPMQVNSSKKFVIIAAKCSKPVKWLLTSKSGTPIEALESRLTNSVLIFMTGKPKDSIIVLAYSVVDGLPSDTAVTVINVDGSGPPPNPGPDPSPAPEPTTKMPSKLHVTFVLDLNKKTRAVSDVIDSADLRQWLAKHGHKVHEISIDEAAKYNIESYIEDKVPPLLVLQAQGEPGIKEGAKVPDGVSQLYSVQAVKDAVLKATGNKE